MTIVSVTATTPRVGAEPGSRGEQQRLPVAVGVLLSLLRERDQRVRPRLPVVPGRGQRRALLLPLGPRSGGEFGGAHVARHGMHVGAGEQAAAAEVLAHVTPEPLAGGREVGRGAGYGGSGVADGPPPCFPGEWAACTHRAR